MPSRRSLTIWPTLCSTGRSAQSCRKYAVRTRIKNRRNIPVTSGVYHIAAQLLGAPPAAFRVISTQIVRRECSYLAMQHRNEPIFDFGGFEMSTISPSFNIMRLRIVSIAILGLAACGLPLPASAGFIQTNLVSDIPGLAVITDSVLKNSWGLSHSATSPIWVSDQATGVATLYNVTPAGVTKNLAVQPTIPTTATGPQGPTGQVNNNTSAFLITT